MDHIIFYAKSHASPSAARNRRWNQRQAWKQGCSTGLRDLARSPAPPGLEAGTPCQTKTEFPGLSTLWVGGSPR